MMIPPIISMVLLFSIRNPPIDPSAAPKMMNIIENPSVNRIEWKRILFLWVFCVPGSTPLKYAKYEGMIGKMHGESTESTPAVKMRGKLNSMLISYLFRMIYQFVFCLKSFVAIAVTIIRRERMVMGRRFCCWGVGDAWGFWVWEGEAVVVSRW